MPYIFFRTDGNEEIATGHIMRCLSIARACFALHMKIYFLVADETSESLLRERFICADEFPVQCLHTDYRQPEEELPVLQTLFSSRQAWLFVDSYFVTPQYLMALQKICRLAYLDDMAAFAYPVDCIVNYDIVPGEEPACYHSIPIKLLGASYTPLREQFQDVSFKVRPKAQNILISTGGTDNYNIACHLLRQVFLTENMAEGIRYHVVTSRLNTHYHELSLLAASYPSIRIHENVKDMAALMSECDLAFSAGGTTLYELCAVGVPSLSFATADNQLTAAKTFSDYDIIPYAGDARLSVEHVIREMIRFLQENSNSYEKRQKSSHKMRAFIDGKGAARIAAALSHEAP